MMVPSQLERCRVARGLDVPQGTAEHEAAAMKCFSEFVTLGNMNEDSVASFLAIPDALPSQNFYSLLTAFQFSCEQNQVIVGVLLLNLLLHATCLKQQENSKIHDKMAAAIDKQNMLVGVQTGEAPDCTLNDLRVLVQETAIKGISFERKNQLSMSTSGELFLHVACIKTSVVQGLSIDKVVVHWE
ncbi:hypothetical protein PHMEG_00027573 [Phytophthora megakarya]|uniref:Uncharacterized protein n=1 Tax=Phytophthora megakarya TaxID=4795 RepID=A0A225V817_9STRA|nr:hypothetical protein PHMEG_00027573 [Phytophthora megakarya]